MADECDALDITCKAQDFLSSTVGDAISKLADAVLDAVGKAVTSLGTMWVQIGTPNLTGGTSTGGVTPGDHAPGTGGIETVLGYSKWIAFGVCVMALMVAGVRLATSRHGEAQQHAERIGIVLIATILVSGAAGIVLALISPVGSTGSPTVAFLRNSLWWYTVAVAMFGVIVAGIRMAWQERAQPGKDLVQGLLTLVVVSGAGVMVVSLLTAAADAFSVWILNGSLDCQLEVADGTCFGGNIATLLALTSTPATGGLGVVLSIILGVFAVFAALAQILLMVLRGGMLVLLTGMLPIAAAASLSDPNRTMLRKTIAWLLAFILYKPAAAIVYATAFKLTGTRLFGDDGLTSVITGLTLMVMALVALPALMRLIVPAIGSMSAGAGVAPLAMAGAAAALPTGAAAAGTLARGGAATGAAAGPSGASGSAGSTGGDGPSGSGGPSGSSGTPGSSGGAGPIGGPGSTGGPGTAGGAGSSGGDGSTGGIGPSGASGGSGAVGTSGTGGTDGAAGANGAAGTPGSAGATGAAGASGASSAGGAGMAAAGAAAGPAVVGVKAAEVGVAARQAATGAAQSATEASAQGGPSGNA